MSEENPEIVAVGFQEIVELSPQQIMSTDPTRRQEWEKVVKRTLNSHAETRGSEKYVLLRGGQLVGASLSIFVKTGLLGRIKNAEGSRKNVGFSHGGPIHFMIQRVDKEIDRNVRYGWQ